MSDTTFDKEKMLHQFGRIYQFYLKARDVDEDADLWQYNGAKKIRDSLISKASLKKLIEEAVNSHLDSIFYEPEQEWLKNDRERMCFGGGINYARKSLLQKIQENE